MPLTVPSTSTPEKWASVDLGDFGAFEVLVRRPNWGQLTAEMSSAEADAEQRIEAVIADWRGLQNADGSAIPFSFDRLKSLCEQISAIAYHLHRVAVNALYAAPETDPKNSASPSSVSDAAAATSSNPAP